MGSEHTNCKQKLDSKDVKWNKKKAENTAAARALAAAEFDNPHRDVILKWSQRLKECSSWLLFAEYQNLSTAELQRKLKNASFCKVRGCPICEWRKSLMNFARGLSRLPAISKEHPSYEFLFLTLTVKNCSVYDLREQIQAMNKAWARLIRRKRMGVVKGYVRTTEVTRSKETGSAHPHFHCILVVPSGYFKKPELYITHERWVQLWRKALKADYDPIVDIKRIKKSKLSKGILETLKYCIGGVTEKDKKGKNKVVGQIHELDPAFFREMLVQLRSLRLINCGGILSDLFKEDASNEDLVNTGLEETDQANEFTDENGDIWREIEEILFSWKNGEYSA